MDLQDGLGRGRLFGGFSGDGCVWFGLRGEMQVLVVWLVVGAVREPPLRWIVIIAAVAGLDDFGSVLCFSIAHVARPWARRLAFRTGAKQVSAFLHRSVCRHRSGAVAAPSWRVRADVCRIRERSSSPWASASPPRATTRVRPYGEGNHKSCPYGLLTPGSCCFACFRRCDWTL